MPAHLPGHSRAMTDALPTHSGPHGGPHGVDPHELSDDDVVREVTRLHETRHETFLHGSADALLNHTRRTTELEDEYLRRHPEREIDPGRLRAGARER